MARARKTKRKKRDDDALAPYRRIRTPTPPPEKVIPDRRRELEQEEARREIEEGSPRRGLEEEGEAREAEGAS